MAGEPFGFITAGVTSVRVVKALVVIGEIVMAGAFCEESV